MVLAPRRWCQVGGLSANDGGKKARSPGRSRSKLLKPLRGESRLNPTEPVVTTLVCSVHFAREAAGAAGTRLSLRPLISRVVCIMTRAYRAAGSRTCAKQRHCEPRLCPPKLNERRRKRRSNPFFLCAAKMDCFVGPVIGRRFAPTRWLAMTVSVVAV